MGKNKLPQDRETGRFLATRKKLVRAAVWEDSFLGDPTTSFVLKKNPVVLGKIIAQESCVLAGVEEALEALEKVGCKAIVNEGETCWRGERVIHVKMKAKPLLSRIRTALNYLSYMSGLATNARRIKDKFGAQKIAALRKTHPCVGASEKRALQIGGVLPHRINLGDGILIKKEHIELLRKEMKLTKEKAVFEAVKRAKAKSRGLFVEIEVETFGEAHKAAIAGPDAILVDNVGVVGFREIAKEIRRVDKEIVVEASGGITEAHAQGYFEAGADVVSGSFVFEAKPVSFKFVLE
jgi:nicotinate-nucleotide pyrophosphorylase (carboxylating)